MEETLNNLFNRAVARVAEDAEEISVMSRHFDNEENKLVARVDFDDIEQDITLQFQSGEPGQGFELGYDRIYLTSSVSEIGTVIVDQTNTAFEDENSAEDAIDEIYTQITNPLSGRRRLWSIYVGVFIESGCKNHSFCVQFSHSFT